jgi:hypothetical protein
MRCLLVLAANGRTQCTAEAAGTEPAQRFEAVVVIDIKLFRCSP